MIDDVQILNQCSLSIIGKNGNGMTVLQRIL